MRFLQKHWLVQMPPEILPSDVTVLDEIYKNRIRTLQAVDDMVKVIINKLQEVNVLSNTYFILASDNGFHIGMNSRTIPEINIQIIYV